MFMFGIAFMLYLIKISAPKGIWYNLRTADPVAHKVAITYQRHYRKVMKAQADIQFLKKCRDAEVYPTNVKWKILRKLKPYERLQYHKRNLKREIDARHETLRNLQKDNNTIDANLKQSLTWMKYMVFKISINRLLENELAKVKQRHGSKFDKLVVEKALKNGIEQNPNEVISNLTGEDLTNEEKEVLSYGLKHGVATNVKEEDIIPVVEAFYGKLLDIKIIKTSHMAPQRVKYALRAFAYNIIEIDDRRFGNDKKIIKVIRNLKKRMIILKPDKGQGVVLIKKLDYVSSMEKIFEDKSKFKEVDVDPTSTRTETIQAYLNTMLKRGEITEKEKWSMRPKAAVRARARGLPKMHKTFENLPPFRPVIDTMNTPYNGIGCFLKGILHPLTQNRFSLKDSFHAVEEIRKIDFDDITEEWCFVSFDVVSLFTNVPLKRTVNIILDRIYKEKKIDVKLNRSTLKKLILDCCTKTTFSFNEKLYEQIDGVCMGSSLGPILANIIMTELEKQTLDKLFKDNIIKFYARYVDDTLVLIKRDKINVVLETFNKFDPNLKFTVDEFEDGIVHFLDITIKDNGQIDMFTKPTNTGQYSHFDSFVPWRYKTSWAYALFVRAMKICSTNKLRSNQVNRIKKLLSWNGFSRYVRNKMISKFRIDYKSERQNVTKEDEIESLCLKIPYCGIEGDKLVKTFKRKIQKQLSRKLSIRVIYTTTKISDLCSAKDPLPEEQKFNVVYKITCPGCGEDYIGKTECCFGKRMLQQGTQLDQPMKMHLEKCERFNDIIAMYTLPDVIEDRVVNVNKDEFIKETVKSNSRIMKSSRDKSVLCYLESFMIQKHKSSINIGIKASKELQLF